MEVSKIRQKTLCRRLLLASLLVIFIECETMALERILSSDAGASGRQNMLENYPNYLKTPLSPPLETTGVAVSLEKAGPAPRESIVLHGTYGITPQVMGRMGGRPEDWIFIIVVRTDRPGVWVRPVGDSSNAPDKKPEPPPDAGGMTIIEKGYFNVELRSFFDLPAERAEYWVMVSLAEWVSQRITFRVAEVEP